MSANPAATEPEAGLITNTSDYQQVVEIEQLNRFANDEVDSFPSDEGEIKPRTRPITVREERVPRNLEIIKQQWDGTVVACEEQLIEVRLEDLTNPGGPDEFVTLSLEEIDSQERSLVEEGAMFLWHIGYRQGPKYPKERFSKIRFRRLPSWTQGELLEAENLAQEYADFFLGDPEQST